MWNRVPFDILQVDVIFADVAQPDQARIVTHNAAFFLKNGGWVVSRLFVSGAVFTNSDPPALMGMSYLCVSRV